MKAPRGHQKIAARTSKDILKELTDIGIEYLKCAEEQNFERMHELVDKQKELGELYTQKVNVEREIAVAQLHLDKKKEKELLGAVSELFGGIPQAIPTAQNIRTADGDVPPGPVGEPSLVDRIYAAAQSRRAPK